MSQHKKHHSIVRKILYFTVYLAVTALLLSLDLNIDLWNDKKFKSL